MKTNRAGFTLVELLVVLAILGILIALLIPAVQAVRESSRRTACQNNVHQMVLAVQSYESSRKMLPPLYNGTVPSQPHTAWDEFHYHSWRAAILGQLEETAVLKMLNMAAPATDVSNQPAINVEIPVFICPSTANENPKVLDVYTYNGGKIPTQIIGTAARSDYEALAGARRKPRSDSDSFNDQFTFGAWGEPRYLHGGLQPKDFRIARWKDISDGLSKTLLFVERGGRPDVYKQGKLAEAYPYGSPSSGTDHHQAAWAISTHIAWLVVNEDQTVNETNASGIYGFHRGGANVSMADGSVTFLPEATDSKVISSMATRAGNN